jgi:hypothetical protein
MASFSKQSIDKLSTCDIRLQNLFNEVVKYTDCTVLCGYRPKTEQDKAFADGVSKTPWPQSKHNTSPSVAVDVVPFPIDWNDKHRFYMFVGVVRGIAFKMGIKLRCGADWNGNMEWKDQNFHDLPHFELEE